MEKRYIHFCEILSYPIHKDDSDTTCGLKVVDDHLVSNNISIVTCRDCMRKAKRYKCFVCSVGIHRNEIRNNDFYPSCKDHRAIAEIETMKFFRENPDYTKW